MSKSRFNFSESFHQWKARQRGLRIFLLTGFPPAPSVWVLSDAEKNSINGDKNRQRSSKSRLYCDENNSSNSFCGLRNAEFLDEDQDARNGQNAHRLDGDVEPLARLRLIWPMPEEEYQHQRFNDELAS